MTSIRALLKTAFQRQAFKVGITGLPKCAHFFSQSRNVSCQVLRGIKEVELAPSRCNETLKPEMERPCNRRLCVFKWTTGEWTPCSATCGKGQREVMREIEYLVGGWGVIRRPESGLPAPPLVAKVSGWGQQVGSRGVEVK